MIIVNVNGNYFLKENDTATEIRLRIEDSQGNALDLSTAPRLEVVIGNNQGRILTKTPKLMSATGELEFGLDEGDVLPVGDNDLEVHIFTDAGERHVAPSKGYYRLRVQRAIDSTEVEITTYSLTYFIDEVNRITAGLPELVEQGNEISERLEQILDDSEGLVEETTLALAQSQESRDLAAQALVDAAQAGANAIAAEQAAVRANDAADRATPAAIRAEGAAEAAEQAKIDADAATAAANLATEAANVTVTDLIGYNRPIDNFNIATSYLKNQAARFNGSTFRARENTQGNPLPVAPAVQNQWWNLEAQRGVDGSGAVSAVAGVLPGADGDVILTPQDIGALGPEHLRDPVHRHVEVVNTPVTDYEGRGIIFQQVGATPNAPSRPTYDEILERIEEEKVFIDAVLDYGVKNDGTDTYAELRALSQAVKDKKDVHIRFKPGTYNIDQYVINSGASMNEIYDITFQNIDGLKIEGYGAVFNVKGDFHRTSNAQKSVIPFKIQNCTNVNLEGFELNGNVDKTTRDEGVIENQSHGLGLYGSKNVTLKDIKSNNFIADGIYICEDKGNVHEGIVGSNRITDNVFGENVICEYNSRQGMSVTQGKNIKFINSKFNYTGYASGTYGGTLPMAGVDIEPNFSAVFDPRVVEDVTKNVTFEQCEFKYNKGSQVEMLNTNFCTGIRFSNCEIESTDDSEAAVVRLFAYDALMELCNIKITNRGHITTYESNSRSNVRFIENRVFSNGQAIKTTNTSMSNSSIINDNYFEGTHTAPYIGLFIDITGPVNDFKGNRAYINSSLVTSIDVLQDVISLQVKDVQDNYYDTNATGVGFNIIYGNTPIVKNETYRPEFARFRPKDGVQTRDVPFTKGITGLGNRAIIYDSSDKTKFYSIDWGAAPPTGGTNQGYTVGSVRFSNDIDSTITGWTCFYATTSTSAWRPIDDQKYSKNITSVPLYVGQEAFVGGVWYKATGKTAASDWKRITNA